MIFITEINNHFYLKSLAFVVLLILVLLHRINQQGKWKGKAYDKVTTRMLQSKEEKDNIHDHHALFIQQSLKSLPLPVQRHLRQALFLIVDDDCGKDYIMHQPVKIASFLKVDQEGSYFLNGRWVPFKGHQYISATPAYPELIWEAKLKVDTSLPFPKHVNMDIRYEYVNGKGSVEAKMMNFFPITNIHDDEQIDNAVLMRWLAEIAMYPTAFFPRTGNGLKWSHDYDEHTDWKVSNNGKQSDSAFSASAKATFRDPNSGIEAELEFHFDESGLMSTIYGVRPRLVGPGIETILTPWEGRVYDYQLRDGILVPTRIEFGWCLHDGFEMILKAENTKFEFTYLE